MTPEVAEEMGGAVLAIAAGVAVIYGICIVVAVIVNAMIAFWGFLTNFDALAIPYKFIAGFYYYVACSIAGKRSGCQNITLAITSFDGVPCRHGYAPLLTMGTLGTDSA